MYRRVSRFDRLRTGLCTGPRRDGDSTHLHVLLENTLFIDRPFACLPFIRGAAGLCPSARTALDGSDWAPGRTGTRATGPPFTRTMNSIQELGRNVCQNRRYEPVADILQAPLHGNRYGALAFFPNPRRSGLRRSGISIATEQTLTFSCSAAHSHPSAQSYPPTPPCLPPFSLAVVAWVVVVVLFVYVVLCLYVCVLFHPGPLPPLPPLPRSQALPTQSPCLRCRPRAAERIRRRMTETTLFLALRS